MFRASLLLALAAILLAANAKAQVANPVYVDLSPVARDSLVRAGEMAAGGNLPGAARELQGLLDAHPDRVAPVGDDPDLFRAVRAQVHRMLLASPELLAHYLATEEARAREVLALGTLDAARAVESSRLLTPAGFEAALRVAQAQLESACFEAARLTLEQLDAHPDLVRAGAPGPARQAAAMYRRVARYLPGSRPEVAQRLARWEARAGAAPPPDDPAERPPQVDAPVFDPLRPSPPLAAAAIPQRPLWSVPIEPPGASEAPAPAANLVVDGKDPEGLWLLPTVAGDTLYINDGTWITARDRFTLQLRWAVEPGRGSPDESRWAAREIGLMRGQARAIEDAGSVTIAGRIVLGTTGLARDGSRDGDPRTHAIDAATGRILWSVHVPALDPQLESGSVRGPVLVDGDTVVVAVRKSAMARRVVSVYLVGLALRTGEPRWVRLVASAGALPFSRERRISDIPVLDRGVVYIVDQLGAAAGVEAATGRPVWVRRMPVVTASDTSLPWRFSAPVPDGPGLFALTPDRREALRIDAGSGRITARRGAGALGEPSYLLAVGTDLAAVGDTRVALIARDDFESGRVRLSKSAGEAGVRGRVVVAGADLVVPSPAGVALVRADRPATPDEAPLSAPGTPLPVPDQLLVLDAREVHSYLAWPVAQRLLRERMTASPDNPEPAVTYTELAYRAGRGDEVAAAADAALAAIDRDQRAHAALRARLFESLREMAAASQDRWGAPPAGDARAPTLDQPALSAVIDRLGRAALTAEDRLTHLMALGRLREAEMASARAIEAYQRVLGDPALAPASWRGASGRVRADVEAASRIRRLVVEHGAGAYTVFDAEAESAVRTAGPTANPAVLEAIARRYPAAGANVALWARIADLHESGGHASGALAALREGLAATDLSRGAGRAPDLAVEGELAGRLVTTLAAQDRVFAAARLLSGVRRDRPSLALTDHGRSIDASALVASLASRLAALQRLPRIGATVRPEVQTLAGWAIMAPLSRERASTPCEHVVMISARESKVALWGLGAPTAGGVAPPGGGPAEAQGPEHLSRLWVRDFVRNAPTLLRVDPESVYLLWDERERGTVVERIDAVTGATRWKSEPLRTLFQDEPGHRERLELDGIRFDTELDRAVEPRHVVCAFDADTLVVAERIGRVVAFDASTGRPMWRAVSEVARVHDLDVGGGLVVIGGSSTPAGEPAAVANLAPVVVVHDAQSGAVVRRLTDVRGPIRWLRLVPPTGTPVPRLVIASGAILGVDPERGEIVWAVEGGPAFESVDAWIFGDRMFVLTHERELWLVALADGAVGDEALDTFERFRDAWPIHAVETPADGAGAHAAFFSSRGVLIFDPGPPASPPNARLVGIDALARSTGLGAFPDAGIARELVMPVPCRDGFVTIESWPTRLPDGRVAYTLHVLDARSGKLQGRDHQLVLWDSPRRVAVLDGRIVVTTGSAGSVTLVYSVPE
ncbi:MAG: PQQ-binding-like beta-propeller repeat protein [Phycisphaerales bacterium]